jgi:hypothetical protein
MPSFTLTLLLPLLSALTLASSTPGEVNPALRPSRPGEPTWYCTVRNRAVLDYYTLEGRNWHPSEHELKAAIRSRGRAITNWFYEDRGGKFVAHVSFDGCSLLLLLPFFFLFFIFNIVRKKG